MVGRPAAVLTENKDPDKESVTENNCPEEPCTSTTVEPDLQTVSADPVPAEPERIVFPTTCSEAEGV